MAHSGSDALQYPIRAVSRMTGISVDTLRAWERRYEAVVPARSDRGRLYSDADVVRLQRLAELVKRGHAIGTIATLADRELERLVERTETQAASAGADEAPAADLGALMDGLDRYDLLRIESNLNRFAAVLPPRDLVFAVIVPLLQEVGRRWEAGTLRPAQEHLVSAIVRSVLGGLLRATARPGATPRLVLATPSGERHELGLLCAALLAASAGYGVVYLGADLPAADIEHAVTEAGARIAMIGLTTPGAVPRAELRRLSKPPRGVELWVGGQESHALLPSLGARGRHVDGLAEVIPMLSRHVH